MRRHLALLAAALVLSSCATAKVGSYGQGGGCLRPGWAKAGEVGMKAGVIGHPIPTIADAGAELAAGAVSAMLQANGVSVAIIIARRSTPLELCRSTGLARGVDPICRNEPLPKP